MWQKIFVVSGFIPLLGLLSKTPGTALFIYSVYVAVYSFHVLRWRTIFTPLPRTVAFILATLATGFLIEAFAWFENYAIGFSRPGTMFSFNLLTDLLIGLGFYGGLAVGFLIILRYFRFTTTQAFVMWALVGIFLEQGGAVFLAGAAMFLVNPLGSLLLWLYVFLVYGSMLAIPYLAIENRFQGTNDSWYKYPAAIICCYLCAAGGTALAGLLFVQILGFPL